MGWFSRRMETLSGRNFPSIYRVLTRGGDFPADIINDVYVFDLVDQATMDGFRRAARLQAQVLGADDGDELGGEIWIFSDPNKERFGEQVPDELLRAAGGFAELGSHGLVRDGDHVRLCERTGREKLDQWIKDRRKDEGDDRALGVVHTPAGPHSITLEKAVGLMREDPMPLWTFEGPRIAK